MSIINIIQRRITLVQGVNGFSSARSLGYAKQGSLPYGKVLPKEIIGTKDLSSNIVHPQTDRTKLSCQKHETAYF